MKVLVVEDEAVSALILEDNLRDLGYEVEVAHDGITGWDRIQDEGFSVVILDWMMPGLTGIDICRRIRERSIGQYTYVILLTGRAELSDRHEALAAGVDDFLTKPIDPFELTARLNVASRIVHSESELLKVNVNLRGARRAEAELGSDIQSRLLLGHIPEPNEYFEAQGVWLASNLVSGDFYDFYPHGEGVMDVVAGDVMGKGIPAAMVAAGVKSSIDKSLLNLLGQNREMPFVQEILAEVGRKTLTDLINLSTFVTLCYARLDAERGVLTYINCGHPKIFRWIARQNRCELLPTTTVPLGFIESDPFEPMEIKLEVGDLILLYSDGVTDLVAPSGELLGSEGFSKWALPLAHQPLANLLADLSMLRDNSTARDDFTCVAIRYLSRRRPRELQLWSGTGGLSRMRRFIGDNRGSLSEDQVGELVLGVQEAASNAVRHARNGHMGIPITVKVVENGNGLRVELRYPGQVFDPTASESDKLDLDREGGLGLPIIRRSVDSLEYSYVGGMNSLVFEKHN